MWRASPPGGGAATFTEAVAAAESQPDAFVSTTVRPSVPAAPAVNVIWFVPFPAVIVPFVIDHAYVLPASFMTLAVSPAWPGVAPTGATMTGVAGVGAHATRSTTASVAERAGRESVKLDAAGTTDPGRGQPRRVREAPEAHVALNRPPAMVTVVARRGGVLVEKQDVEPPRVGAGVAHRVAADRVDVAARSRGCCRPRPCFPRRRSSCTSRTRPR